jgi:hypothetical protein
MIVKLLGKTVISGKTVFGTTGESAPMLPYNLWEFLNSTGTSLSNVNLLFAPSTTVQIDWGDGSIEPISSDTNYNHTLN